jgi:hypothetical protein
MNCSGLRLPGSTPMTCLPKSTNLAGSAEAGKGKGTNWMSLDMMVVAQQRALRDIVSDYICM